jgi:hypothetical protein
MMNHEVPWFEIFGGGAVGAFIAAALVLALLSPPLQAFLISFGAIGNTIGVAVQVASIFYARHLFKRVDDAREELTRRHRAAIATIAKGEAMGFIIENFEMDEGRVGGPKGWRPH